MSGTVKTADKHADTRVAMAFERHAVTLLIDSALARNNSEPAAVAALEEVRAAVEARASAAVADGRPCWHCQAVVKDDALPCPMCGSAPEYREGARLVRDVVDLLERANGLLVHLQNWTRKRGLWGSMVAANSVRVMQVVVGKAHIEQLRMLLDEDVQHTQRAQQGNHLTVIKGEA